MKIFVEELETSLSWDYTAPKKKVIKAVRLWLYKHLSPSGNLNVKVTQSSQELGISETVTSAYLETNTDATALNYFHGYVTFNFDSPIVIQTGTFTVELEASGGYSFSESAYFGWVKPHENNLLTTSEASNQASDNPYGIQLWEYRSRL